MLIPGGRMLDACRSVQLALTQDASQFRHSHLDGSLRNLGTSPKKVGSDDQRPMTEWRFVIVVAGADTLALAR